MPVYRKPLSGWTDPGARFTCPICGAVYAVAMLPAGNDERDYVRCLVCGTQLEDWNTAEAHEYTLLDEPKA